VSVLEDFLSSSQTQRPNKLPSWFHQALKSLFSLVLCFHIRPKRVVPGKVKVFLENIRLGCGKETNISSLLSQKFSDKEESFITLTLVGCLHAILLLFICHHHATN